MARVFAFRVARAADKGAVTAHLDGKLAFLAKRAKTRIRNEVSICVMIREDVRGKGLVQGVQNLGNAQVLGLFDVGCKLLPELLKEDFPVQLAI